MLSRRPISVGWSMGSSLASAGFALGRKDDEVRKGFTRKPQASESGPQGKNYITPGGLQRLKEEHRFLLARERPAVTK
ncbi:MAG TPA: hypothetical protein VG273_22295, partial [Bryobacteraceae bacterium]|nr:hypothetical protein [Bryobacteraceae bacterium]